MSLSNPSILDGINYNVLVQDITIKLNDKNERQNDCIGYLLSAQKEKDEDKFNDYLVIVLTQFSLFNFVYYPIRNIKLDNQEVIVNKNTVLDNIPAYSYEYDEEIHPDGTALGISDIIPFNEDRFNIVNLSSTNIVARPNLWLKDDLDAVKEVGWETLTDSDQIDLAMLRDRINEAVKSSLLKSLSF